MKKSTKVILYLFIAILMIVVLIINQKENTDNSKPMVSVTTFSLYDIVNHIASDTVNIISILPFGVDPHAYEPTPKLVAKIEKSALIIYSGAGLEPWIHGFEFKNRVIDMSRNVTLRELGDEESHEHHHHHEGTFDPHYWLSFSNMEKSVILITKQLIEIVPQNKKLYIKNRDDYLLMLKKLDAAFKQKLAVCVHDTIVVNHNAFGYLSDGYNFNVESLSGLSPDAQPNAKNMMRLIQIIKEHNISTVFFESFASDRTIQSIAKEANVKVGVLQPLGNVTADEAKKNLTYEDMMKENLFKLSKALDCH